MLKGKTKEKQRERQGGFCWCFSPQENLFVWVETWAQKTVLVFILKEED